MQIDDSKVLKNCTREICDWTPELRNSEQKMVKILRKNINFQILHKLFIYFIKIS